MTLKLPRDYKLYNCYRRLKDLHGGDDAIANQVFMQLWVDLGYQVDCHGRAGRIKRSECDGFNSTVGRPGAFLSLLESQCLIPANDEEYVCPMFENHNPELDRDFLPATARGRATVNFLKKVNKHQVKAIEYAGKLPPACWYCEDGVTKILDHEMKRIILVIKMLDNLLGQDRRQFNHYTPGLVQAGHSVIRKWSEDKLMVILKRLYMVRGTIKDLPRATGYALQDFENMVWKIMPDEGFLRWDGKRGNESET